MDIKILLKRYKMERKTMDISEAWDYLPYDYTWRNMDNFIVNTEREPVIMDNEIKYVGRVCVINGFIITGIDENPFKSLVKRPVKIEIGMFGKFWNNFDVYHYGYLKSKTHIRDYPYHNGLDGLGCFANFEPIDPATLPKKIEVK
jgi:hypothetical protein